MRVIAGKYKKRKLHTLEGPNTRPTTDRNKENMFNLIGPYFDGGDSLDLFGGSGGLSIEGLSRGIDHAYIVDKSNQAMRVIEKNIKMIGIGNDVTLLRADYRDVLKRYVNKQFDLVLIDPPFAMLVIDEIVDFIDKNDMLTEDGVIIAEYFKENTFEQKFDTIECTRFVDYGTSHIKVYRKK